MKLIIGTKEEKEKVFEVTLGNDGDDIDILVDGHLIAFLSPEGKDKPRLYVVVHAEDYVKFKPATGGC